MKTCTKCLIEKELDAFYKDSNCRGGRSTHCNSCQKAARRAHYLKNKEAYKARAAAWRIANPAKRQAICAKHYAANAKTILCAHKARRAVDPEPHRKASLAWLNKNRERSRATKFWWKQANPGKVLAATRQRQTRKSGQLCDCCQTDDGKVNMVLVYALAKTLKMHVDHIRPLSKGGAHCLHNLQFLTPLDNMRKGAKWQEAA